MTVREEDAADVDGEFDRVLLDPPCSDLGTLQSRPDVRWKKEEGVGRAASPRSRRACWTPPPTASGRAARSSTPRARSHRTRTSARSTAFLERRADFRLDELPEPFGCYAHPTADGVVQVLPHRHGTDGFFIARLT